VTGILAPPMDPDALSGAIESLLKDNQRAAEMGEEGYRVCGEKFSSRKMIGEIRKLYDEYRAKIRQ